MIRAISLVSRFAGQPLGRRWLARARRSCFTSRAQIGAAAGLLGSRGPRRQLGGQGGAFAHPQTCHVSQPLLWPILKRARQHWQAAK